MGKTFRAKIESGNKVQVPEKRNHFERGENKQTEIQQARSRENQTLNKAVEAERLDDLAMPIKKHNAIRARR